MLKHIHIYGENHFTPSEVENIKRTTVELALTDNASTVILLEQYDDDYEYYKHKLKNRAKILPLEYSTYTTANIIHDLDKPAGFWMREMGMFQRIKTIVDVTNVDRIVVVMGDTHIRESKHHELGPALLKLLLTEWCLDNNIQLHIHRSNHKEVN